MVSCVTNEIDFFGLRITSNSIKYACNLYNDAVREKRSYILFGWSLTTIPKIREFPRLFETVNSFDFNIPDGRGLYCILRLLGYKFEGHDSIPDMVEFILSFANDKKIPVYLLGGTKEINDNSKIYLQKKYTSIPSIYGRNGYFCKNETKDLIAEISAISPGIVLIGISSPLKEDLAVQIRNEVESCLIFPCGGVIDIYGGKTKREPALVKRLALTWLYRFMLEPKRLFYPVLVNGIKCITIDLPICFFQRYILRNSKYTFNDYYN